jgi:hypothetical protein
MDFDLESEIEMTEECKKVIELLEEYKSKFGEFDTWWLDDKELLERLNRCLTENKPYEKIYGKTKYRRYLDY